MIRTLLFCSFIAGLLHVVAPAYCATPATAAIEDEVVVQTPVSEFIVEAVFKEFVAYAKQKWSINVKPGALRAGTPVSYDRIAKWNGKPEADIFWGGESALYDKLAAQNLLVRLEIPEDVWASIPA